jgi:hypothetical protein
METIAIKMMKGRSVKFFAPPLLMDNKVMGDGRWAREAVRSDRLNKR